MRNLILIWFVGNLNTAPLLRQRHIGRVGPRFVWDRRQEPEGSDWGFSIRNTLCRVLVKNLFLLPTVKAV